MKIVTPEQFESEQKDNLLYVGRLRAANYLWPYDQGSSEGQHRANILAIERLGTEFNGDLLVSSVTNSDDDSWAQNYLSGKIGMDDSYYVAAAELYRDSRFQRKAQYIDSEMLAQIEPQLDYLGQVGAGKMVGSSYDQYGAKSKLLENATEKGADYVVLGSNNCQEFTILDLPEFVANSEGRIYRLKRAKINEVEATPARPQFTFDPAQLEYTRRLLAGIPNGTVMDWKK